MELEIIWGKSSALKNCECECGSERGKEQGEKERRRKLRTETKRTSTENGRRKMM